MSGSDFFYLLSMLCFLGVFVGCCIVAYKWGGKPYDD